MTERKFSSDLIFCYCILFSGWHHTRYGSGFTQWSGGAAAGSYSEVQKITLERYAFAFHFILQLSNLQVVWLIWGQYNLVGPGTSQACPMERQSLENLFGQAKSMKNFVWSVNSPFRHNMLLKVVSTRIWRNWVAKCQQTKTVAEIAVSEKLIQNPG